MFRYKDINYKKFNGYQRLNKNRHLIAKEIKLSDAQFRLWDLFSALCGWDSRYEHLYRKVQITQKEIALILDWDESKVSRVSNSLIRSGLIEKTDRSEYIVRVLAEKGSENENNEQIAKIQEKLAKSQKPLAEIQNSTANSQEKRSYINNSSLVSFKSNSPLRTDGEYLSIWREYGYPKDFDVSDMKFIDQVIYKESGIRPN